MGAREAERKGRLVMSRLAGPVSAANHELQLDGGAIYPSCVIQFVHRIQPPVG